MAPPSQQAASRSRSAETRSESSGKQQSPEIKAKFQEEEGGRRCCRCFGTNFAPLRSELALSGAVLFFFFSDSVRNLAKLKCEEFLLFCQMKDILEFRVTVPLIGNRKKNLITWSFHHVRREEVVSLEVPLRWKDEVTLSVQCAQCAKI